MTRFCRNITTELDTSSGRTIPYVYQAPHRTPLNPQVAKVEAASARYAARDRFTYPGESAPTPLQRYIQNACDPQNFEPNLALSLEIADLINAKKGNAPREAAVSIVQYVNHRNPNVSLLALSLLDICVKNCGYPFHLQISTKEFLNELVRRFPERPAVRPTRVQHKILELIEEWRCTICKTSKYKEDLGFIRDMHRLLSYKGYVFPEVKKEDAAVLNPSDNLRSVEEMEEEEHQAQSAKLQELIRRGTPHDLQEANKLMKIMAGYDNRHKTDYRAKAAEEVGKIQQKARLLEEMLQGYKQGDEIKEGDVFEELANALASAQPKIQRMCEEESEDHEAVAKLFEINDSIHRTIQRYKLVKVGDLDGANNIKQGTLGITGAGVKKGANNELSLIDFGSLDDEAPPAESSASSQPPPPPPKGNSLEDDLLGLSIGPGDSSFGSGGALSYGLADLAGAGPSTSHKPKASASDIMSQFNTPPPPQSAKPTYDAFAALAQPTSTPASPTVNLFSQPPPQPQQAQQPMPKPGPFAALSGTSRTSSPFQFQQAFKAPGSPITAVAAASKQPRPTSLLSNGDDEWSFTSSLPPQQVETKDIQVTNSNIRTVFTVSRPSGANDWLSVESKISNNTAQPISDLTFQLAVTKGYSLKLEPQSSRNLGPNQKDGITQSIKVQGVNRGTGQSVKMRWRASYSVAGQQQQDEQGMVESLGVN
ncbi:VHS domain-containing protein [Delphinella strobiligena]|nr:VHS domain-containing protein [Delphinella strobiligena]